ncbi:phosphoheptose isomerase 2 [Bacteroidota bacterium]|nr:phosphoheptose isomerase 2 [Bacteroidota bacterium]
MNKEKINAIIKSSIEVKQKLLTDEKLLTTLIDVTTSWCKTLEGNGRILFCGNGGSAADAQHIAAELSGRFYFDREPLDAEALHVNTSYLTAVANDYSYDEVYSRMVRAKGKKGDMLVGISTSGNSANVIKAMEQAKKQGMIVVAMTGKNGGKMRDCCDFLINVPSNDTPRIQECHIMVGHILCELTEEQLFKKNA